MDKQQRITEIEVTPEMVEAAATAFDRSGVLDYPDVAVNRHVIRKMVEAAILAGGYVLKSDATSRPAGKWRHEYECPADGYRIIDADDGVIAYALTESNADMVASAPTMYQYITRRAQEGCADAKSILEGIDVRSSG